MVARGNETVMASKGVSVIVIRVIAHWVVDWHGCLSGCEGHWDSICGGLDPTSMIVAKLGV